ncbi:MAG TPA: sugar ABC transporter substrate-binding protein, partial [Acidimicrobiia bacterium]
EWIFWGLADSLNRIFAGEDPATLPNQGGGWQFVDAEHNIPPEGESYSPPVDFRTAYTAIWEG